MRGHTHLIAGAACVVPLGLPEDHSARLVAICITGAIAALLPDLDHPFSLAGRCLSWPSATRSRGVYVQYGRRWFSGTIWHRDQFHSIFAGLLFAILSFPLFALVLPLPSSWAPLLSAAVAVGYWSHLLLDTCNKTPQMLFWPFNEGRFHAPWPRVAQATSAGALLEGVVVLASIAFLFHVAITAPTLTL